MTGKSTILELRQIKEKLMIKENNQKIHMKASSNLLSFLFVFIVAFLLILFVGGYFQYGKPVNKEPNKAVPELKAEEARLLQSINNIKQARDKEREELNKAREELASIKKDIELEKTLFVPAPENNVVTQVVIVEIKLVK